MDLIEKAPMKDYPKVLITGVTYESDREDGFPDKATIETLYEINDKLETFLKKQFDVIHVGSFTHNFERLGYFYIKSDKNLEKKLKNFYKKNYPKFKSYINIKDDQKWEAYTNFLYPNEQTLNYMQNMKVISALADAGDLLNKERRIDHWLWFFSEEKLKEAIPKLEKSGYTVVGYKKVEDQENLYSIQIWKNSTPDIESITIETLKLTELAKEYQGDYDGWETFIVKE